MSGVNMYLRRILEDHVRSVRALKDRVDALQTEVDQLKERLGHDANTAAVLAADQQSPATKPDTTLPSLPS
jgi:uncharacterized small protein (DUF1192 family)